MKPVPAIVMTETFWQKLYDHLIRVSPETPRPVEQMAFILASVNQAALGTRLIAREMVLAGPALRQRQPHDI